LMNVNSRSDRTSHSSLVPWNLELFFNKLYNKKLWGSFPRCLSYHLWIHLIVISWYSVVIRESSRRKTGLLSCKEGQIELTNQLTNRCHHFCDQRILVAVSIVCYKNLQKMSVYASSFTFKILFLFLKNYP
jgi:hypothetical protein